MDIQDLATLVMQKFKEAGGYSELEDKALLKNIYKALNIQYQKNFYFAKKKIKEDEARGIVLDKDKYDKQYAAVEDSVIAYANKLAATEKHEV